MTDYTPTTEQVRDAYVRGMRDTFIASAGEHREEFDRWVQARDDDVRASVQPPTREQIISAITCGNTNSVCDFEVEIADRVLALLRKGADR